MKNQLVTLAEQAIQDRVTPGGVIGIINREGNKLVIPFGHHTYDLASPEVKEDSVYDLASITKSIPTSSLVLKLIDDGELGAEEALAKYLPEFQARYRESITIQHLLTYTVQGEALSRQKTGTAAEIRASVLRNKTPHFPGAVFKYTNTPAFLLGLLAERMYGMPLDQAAESLFFKPLGMKDTTFHPQQLGIERIVPTEDEAWRGLVRGVVHDESAFVFSKENQAVGHAGLFGTAEDLLQFLLMLLREGSLDGTTYFSPALVKDMHRNQIEHLGDHCGLGWELCQPRYMSELAHAHTFGKTGFTGTLVVCDPVRGTAFVLLTNRTFPKRPADSRSINAFRSAISRVILSSSLPS